MEQTKGLCRQSYSFSSRHVWMRSWTKKKVERWRIDAFELWHWRRLLRVPWTARRSNQSILKEIGPEYSLETLMLKLKLQYLGHLMWRVDSLEKTLILGKIEGGRRRGRQRMRWLGGIIDSMDVSEQTLGVGDGQGSLVCCSPWGRKEWDMTDWATELKWNRKRKAHMSLNAFLGIKRNWVVAGSAWARPLCSAVSPAAQVLVLKLGSAQYIPEKWFLMRFHFGQFHLFLLFLSLMCVLNGNSYFLKYVCDLTFKSEMGK